MRFLNGFLALLLTGGLIAQTEARKEPASTKEIMTSMTIPASNALFGVSEKPTDKEWAELRAQALLLSESGALLLAKGRVKEKADNPADWNRAAKALRAAGQSALAAVNKKNADLLAGDVGGQILDTCSSCHEKYLPKQ